jgi:hypothetical protein
MSLVVAGNESLPNGEKNTWNYKKSKALLQFYDIESEGESDTETEEKSRKKRLKLAKIIGIQKQQINLAYSFNSD